MPSNYHLGVGVDFKLPGADDPGDSLSSPVLDGRLLAAWVPSDSGFRAGSYAGFRYDLSGGAGAQAERLRTGDRIALGLSDSHAVLAGVAAGYRFDQNEVLVETTWDLLVGSDAPAALDSPLRATLGFRRDLSKSASLGVVADILLSGRPDVSPLAALVPIEPRVRGLLVFGYRFSLVEQPVAQEKKPEVKPKVEPKPKPKPVEPEPAPTGAVEVNVYTDKGHPLSDATVTIVRDGEQTVVPHSNMATYRIEGVKPGAATIVVKAARYKTTRKQVTIAAGDAEPMEVKLVPGAAEGQIRGLIRSFAGEGLAATVRIEPLGKEVETDEDGTFIVDLAPGQYQVIIKADGYRTQRRRITVEKDGVTILNADLGKATR
jgi:hypothetical protein